MLLFELIVVYGLQGFHGSFAAPISLDQEKKVSYGNETLGKEIIFPDSELNSSGKAPLVLEEPPKCANGLTFCEEVDAYPYRLVRDALRKMKAHKEAFMSDDDEEPIEHRLGEPNDKNVCRSIERTIYPKVAKNKRNKWKYIINRDEDSIQGVRIELCERQNGKCDLLSHLPFGYTTSCKQKYIYRKLMSLSEDGEIMTDSFPIPSACCCSYRRNRKALIHFTENFNPQIN